MDKRSFTIFLMISLLLAGCSSGLLGTDRAELIHRVESDSVRTIHPDGVFDSPAFRESENIHAKPLVSNQGHSAVLAQIKDREKFHVHDKHDLVVYLKSGRGTLRTEHRDVTVEPGDWTFIQRGVAHQFVTTSEKPARAVVIRTPPVEGDRRTVKK